MDLPPVTMTELFTAGRDRIVTMPEQWRPDRVSTDPVAVELKDGQHLFDLPIFQKIDTPVAEELIVDPPTVQQLLDQIRAMQEPEQAEIRRRNRGRESLRPRLHAQIMSFG